MLDLNIMLSLFPCLSYTAPHNKFYLLFQLLCPQTLIFTTTALCTLAVLSSLILSLSWVICTLLALSSLILSLYWQLSLSLSHLFTPRFLYQKPHQCFSFCLPPSPSPTSSHREGETVSGCANLCRDEDLV